MQKRWKTSPQIMKILAEAKAQRDLILKEAREMKESLIKDAKEKATLEAEK